MNGQGKRARGVTLLELMVTLAVLAVLAMIAVPNLSDVMRRHRVGSVTGQLRADLAYARAEAVTRGSFVSICASSTGEACNGSADYATGWIVYSHPAGAAGADQAYDAGKDGFALLRAMDAPTGIAIQATDGDVISYGQQGQLKRNLPGDTYDFRICSRPSGGQPENTTSVPGSVVRITGAGMVMSQAMALGDACL
ncbi:GspH/FimT family pseudopilin [Dyella sedimenti]|uniref:GspH/FimT family pseudopilin n=1 Tax=Dyella sedimenti TaxID=2919947 RepID=UPI001FAA8DA8|nr:GspH/FimT family pseudopilin [Dyella sedimenti]